MKSTRRKKPLTFGELVMAVYDAADKRRARGMVRLAVNGHLVKFRGGSRFEISEPEPKFSRVRDGVNTP